MRNSRPITYLDTGYKLLAKVLAERFKHVMGEIISLQQAGCTPGRQITDNTRLCQLLQACQAEHNQKGLMLFLGLEKAFDRVSHA